MFTNCRNITGAKIQMQEKNKMMSKCLKKLARKFKCKTKIEIKMLAQQLIKCRNKIGAKFQISAYLFIQTFVNKKSMEQQVVRTSAHYANNKDIPTRHKGTSFEVEKNRVKNCTDHFSCKLFFHCPYFFPAYLCTLQR